MAKSVGNIRGLAEVLDEVGARRADPVLLHRPLPPADRLHAPSRSRTRAQRGARGSARPAGGWSRATRRTSSRALRDAFFDALPTTSTRRGAGRRCSSGSRAANRCRGPVGDGDLREMLGVLGLEILLDARGRARPPRRSTLAERREAARAANATSPRPTACATSCARSAGRCATARRDRSSSGRPERRGRRPPKRDDRAARSATSSPAARRSRRAARGSWPRHDRLRPQRGARGAARPPAGRTDLGDGGAPRGVAGRAGVVAAADESSSAAAPTPTRASAPRSTRTATPTPPSCSRRPIR